MTHRLYYTDSYLRDFESTVVDRAEGDTRIYLDRTGFYPTSGGQPCDTGRLGGIVVVDVVDEGDRIAHLLASPLAEDRVAGRIDWERRFDHMQQHSGQHLVSAVLAELFGHKTVSVHFGRDSSSLDLDTAALSHDQVVAAEERANAVVVENRPVEVSFEEAGHVAGLRRDSPREGTLRIVTIRDLDRSACGGTHVRATGEIGPILIGRIERVRQRVRIEFLCGARAVRRTRADRDLLSGIAAPLSAAADELPALLEAQRGELRESAAAVRRLEAALAGYRANELYRATPPDPAGLRRIVLRENEGGVEHLRALAHAVTTLPRAVLLATIADPPAILLAASADAGIDAGRELKAALTAAGGRGGGNPTLAQGTAPREALDRVVEVLTPGGEGEA